MLKDMIGKQIEKKQNRLGKKDCRCVLSLVEEILNPWKMYLNF